MAEIQYRNRSISQLVSQLNTLGEENVLLAPLRLLAIHQKDLPDVKRFKNSHGSQFFIPKNSQKKFAYNQIVQSITSNHLQPLKQFFLRGFNVSVILCPSREQGKVTQLLSEIGKIVGNCGCSCSSFSQQGIVDVAGGSKINQRDFQNRLRFYKVMEVNIIPVLDKMLRGHAKASINVVKLRSLSQGQMAKNEINLIALPQQFFSANLKPTEFLGSCKSQLTQIFNYLKLNPTNKYQHYSKLLTKRIPVTNVLASLILEQTAGFIINWMNEGNLEAIHERLSFYDKMREISVLLKKEEGYMPLLNELPSVFYSPKPDKILKTKDSKFSKTDRTPVAAFQEENDLEYCRSLQRKTHRYSINDIQLFDQQIQSPYADNSLEKHYSKTPSPVTHNNFQRTSNKTFEIRQFDITVPKRLPHIEGDIKQSEQIAMIKANHAIQISQYHQTIQQLNRKILALMNEKDMGQLYSIHEREIMLLQLKIKQLREDVAVLCKESDEKTYKGMVRKLNEEIKRLENKNSEQKVANGKTTMLEKQLKEIRSKYDQSQKARNKLSFQLQHLTKRLKICDSEIEMLNNKQINLKDIISNPINQNGKLNTLSMSDTQTLKKMQVLLRSIQDGNQQSKSYLIRMITNVLTDLTSCRSIILECNDFLVQLEEHLQEKLGIKQPQIVLDCNKFIRNFLMDNLNVF